MFDIIEDVSICHDLVAIAMQTNQSLVKITSRRVGGGFGGKGTKSTTAAVAAAIDAKLTGCRPGL